MPNIRIDPIIATPVPVEQRGDTLAVFAIVAAMLAATVAIVVGRLVFHG